jgi:hypothetical protein
MNNLSELTTATNSGTLTVAGTTTLLATNWVGSAWTQTNETHFVYDGRGVLHHTV